jgi:hypothetical protein
MGAHQSPRDVWRRGWAAAALLAGLLFASSSHAAAAGPAWSLEGNGLLAVPVSPESFRSGWDASWGLSGSVRRTVGTRVAVGIEGEYAQYGLGDIAGEGVGGGTRHWGSLRVPVLVTLWDGARHGDFGLMGSAGYTHQSIEPITNAQDRPPTGSADGFSCSAGLRYSHPLRDVSRWSLGIEYVTAFLAHETPGAVHLRFGIVTPLTGSPPTP